MGLSASQARLLSITARLSDNELHSQQIANAKVRLADQTQEASAEYIKALDSSKLVYTSYDEKGNQTCVDLTPGLMYTYSPLKNQYAMMTSDNKIMVSSTDAKNYEEAENIVEFLIKYNVLDKEQYQNDKASYENKLQKYNNEKAQYDSDMITYSEAMDEYNAAMVQYNKDYKEWLENKDKDTLYTKFVDTVGRSDMTQPSDYTQRCYYDAVNNGSTCYLHVLDHLLDYNGVSPISHTYTSSIGKEVTTDSNGGNMQTGLANKPELKPTIKEISDGLNNPEIKCDGADDFTPYYNSATGEDILKGNIIQEAINSGKIPTEFERLISDYMYDEETNTCLGVKTLKQKAIDLFYVIKNNSKYTSEIVSMYGNLKAFMRASMINFTEGDMKNISPKPETPVPPTMPTAPIPPTKPNYLASLTDKDKGQWYVNLWNAMNGSKTSNLVEGNDEVKEDVSGILCLSDVSAMEKSVSGGSYKVLEDNLMSSSSWLKFALEQGVVTLAKAEYYNPSADSNKALESTSAGITWQSIAYSSAVDIHEVDDEIAIAKAEAEYTQKLNEIEAKDKKYDNDIKKLDTEHNALKTEYESVQTVINKNVERSFKAFS